MAGEKTNVNYTAEMTAQVVEMYKAGEAVEAIANAVGRTARSVIAKLSREGVYESKAKTAGAKRVTKADLVAKLAEAAGIEKDELETLEKGSHDALEKLVKAFVTAE